VLEAGAAITRSAKLLPNTKLEVVEDAWLSDDDVSADAKLRLDVLTGA